MFESSIARIHMNELRSFTFAIASDLSVFTRNGAGVRLPENVVFHENGYEELFGLGSEHLKFFPKAFQQSFGSIQSDVIFPDAIVELCRDINIAINESNLKASLHSNQLYNQSSKFTRRSEMKEAWRNLPISEWFSARTIQERKLAYEGLKNISTNLVKEIESIIERGSGPRYEVVLKIEIVDEIEDVTDQGFLDGLRLIEPKMASFTTESILPHVKLVLWNCFPLLMLAYNFVIFYVRF